MIEKVSEFGVDAMVFHLLRLARSLKGIGGLKHMASARLR